MTIKDDSITPKADDFVSIKWAGEGSFSCILLADKDGDLVPVRRPACTHCPPAQPCTHTSAHRSCAVTFCYKLSRDRRA
eukprot:COSAG01_NODE_5651_length_4117_cov_1.371173_5_plen_79_part_00